MSHIDLTKEDILKIARLADLTVTDEAEIEQYRQQLSETITYVENLNELDTKKVKPASHSTNLTNVFFEDGTANERALHINRPFIVPRIMK